MANEETIKITETDAEGNETTIEITSTKADDAEAGDESLVEEIVEALFDVEIGQSDITEESETEDVEESEADYDPTLAADPAVAGSDIEYVDNTLADQDLAAAENATGLYDLPHGAVDTFEVGTAAAGVDDATGSSDADPEAYAEAAEQQMHADAAREAQEAADEFVEQGDYAAAAQARETAENEAWEAGDYSMLDGSDSIDLDAGAERQADAEYYQQQQAEHAREGDYEAALEDSRNAEYAVKDADYLAGGSDHSGQAAAEKGEMEWAVWDQDIADENARDAAAYAAEGDFDKAEIYAEAAAEAQEAADHHGDLGEHGGDIGVYDPSSEVASGGEYDASAGDVDTELDSADTGYDPGIDSSTDFSE